MPDDPKGPARPLPKTPPKAPAITAAAVLIATAILTAPREGFVPKAEPDPVGIATICFGERVDLAQIEAGRIYSREECMVRLRARMTTEYAPKIERCLPQIVSWQRINVYAALLDAAWNAGPDRVCASRMAGLIRAGKWADACKGFYGWFTTAKDRRTGVRKVYPGLVSRRSAEAALCLRPVPETAGFHRIILNRPWVTTP